MKQTVPLLRNGERVGTADVELNADGSMKVEAKLLPGKVLSLREGLCSMGYVLQNMREQLDSVNIVTSNAPPTES